LHIRSGNFTYRGQKMFINRENPFDQERFFCAKFKVVHDPYAHTGMLISVPDLKFMSPTTVHGPRLAHLDAKAFETLWDGRQTLPPEWREFVPQGWNFFQFYFWGTKLINEFGIEHVLYMRWADNYHDDRSKRGFAWHWGIIPTRYNWGYPFPAVMSSFNR
jgi:hypothetical protein